MAFPLLPALHLENGRVREAAGPPVDIIQRVARRHEEAVLVDAAGLQRNQPDIGILQTAARSRAVWADMGSRTTADIADLFIAGASRVTARWNTVHDLDELTDAAEVAEDVYVGVEVAARFVENPRDRAQPRDLARLVDRTGIGVVIIDLAARREPSYEALSVAEAFAGAAERWYMGALAKDAVLPLADKGFDGAILPVETLEEEKP